MRKIKIIIFLGEKNLRDCDFTTRVLDCMFFTSFVSERGPPWRPCDVWDELYSNLNDLFKKEMQVWFSSNLSILLK